MLTEALGQDLAARRVVHKGKHPGGWKVLKSLAHCCCVRTLGGRKIRRKIRFTGVSATVQHSPLRASLSSSVKVSLGIDRTPDISHDS